MTESIKILCFAGSSREDSANKKLARLSAQQLNNAEVSATFVDLRDYPMPIYDGDEEAAQAYPEHAARLKPLFLQHQGFVIASPEYNSSFSGLLKNTIDWLSRDGKGGGDLSAFQNKVAALTSASPGALGGLRGLVHLRSVLSNIGVHVIPQQLAVGSAYSAFDDNGMLKDQRMQTMLDTVLSSVADVTARLAS